MTVFSKYPIIPVIPCICFNQVNLSPIFMRNSSVWQTFKIQLINKNQSVSQSINQPSLQLEFCSCFLGADKKEGELNAQ